MISSTLGMILLIAVCAILLVLLVWGLKKMFKTKIATAIIIGICVVPVLVAGLLFGVISPNVLYVIEGDSAGAYYLFGETTDYEMADGSTLAVKCPELGSYIINNSSDRYVLEKQVYSNYEHDERADILIDIAPNSGAPMNDLWVDYVLSTPPESIEVDANATSAVIKFWLRKYDVEGDPVNFYYLYEGETLDGNPEGHGIITDLETGESYEGEFKDSEYLGDGSGAG